MLNLHLLGRSAIMSIAAAGFILHAASVSGQECPYAKNAPVVQQHEPHFSLVAFQESAAKADIVDTAVGAGNFTTLVAAVKAAGLVDALKGDGPFTVFAPSDAAFEKIPAETLANLLKPENKKTLTDILTYHVVKGNVLAADVVSMDSAEALNGKTLKISAADGNVTVNNAQVVATDIVCGNGVIHVVDSVIMPPSEGDETAASKDIVDTAVGNGKFKTLVAAVKAAGLVETLKGAGPFTVFAPTDDAFAQVPEATLAALLKPENKEQLQGILTYHVVAGKVMAADVVELSSADTVNGKSVTIKVVDGKVNVGNATVVATDIECENGVIHVIDAVLMP